MFNFETVKAHCDVPCGIYDTNAAQNAALSVIRMIDLIAAAEKGDDEAAYLNSMARYISVKESEAVKCKEEIRIIWGDFIKPPHIEAHPEIHTVAHNIMMLAGAAKQHTSRDKAMALLAEVNKFAEIFWGIKGVETKVVKAPYMPGEDIVIPVL
ncbi:MAG: superoxide dismutase, Ni [Gammaproteobacteria bacterium]|nr:superoxide dismutase, Ni [Gammaproteobacteria bacterium]